MNEADIKDRDGVRQFLTSIHPLYAWLRRVVADGNYAGDKLRTALKGKGARTLDIVKRCDIATGFNVSPCRQDIEEAFAWLGRCRTLIQRIR